MANLKDLIVNGVSRFIGKVFIDNSHINTINGVAVTETPKFTDTIALGSMTGTLGVDHGGTGQTTGKNAANYFMNALSTGSLTPNDNDYYISQYVGGGTTTTTYLRRPVSALWEYIKGKISSVLGLTATTYGGSAAKVNNHTVNSDVPANAVFTDTKNTAGSTDTSSKIFLIGATSQATNPQTYSQDTAYVGTDGKLYSNSKVVLTGGSNASSSVTITPSTTDVYSMTSAGSVTAGTKNVPTKIDTTKFSGGSFTRGTFSQGTLPTLTFAMDSTDTKKLKITFGQGTLPTHAADSFTAAAIQSGFYTAGTANTPTAVTLPGRSSVIKAWTGYSSATAAAQTFTGSSN